MDVLVEHDYRARDSKELSITKGDVIRNVIKQDDGWWEGTLNNKKGIFPDKYVKIIDKDTNVILRNTKDSARIRQCRVVFSYKQDHEDELNLKVGDIIDILGEVEEGWWRGLLNGKEGVFPSNFVKEIPLTFSPKLKVSSKENLTDINNISEEPLTPSIFPKLDKIILCKVKYSYKAQNEDELTLKEGDVVTLVSKEGLDVGWWKGELNGVVGLFPDNFVIILNDGNERKCKTPEPESKPIKTTSVRKSLENDNKAENDLHPAAKTPPLPGKKPLLPIKKSPSNSGSSGGIFSGLKKKIVDVVDGTTGSKNSTPPKTEINSENNNDFDDVVRRPLLSDVRAFRPKAPGRRLPSAIYKEPDSVEAMNGNDDQHAIPDLVTLEPTPESPSSELDGGVDGKPKLREWEKHKAPWLEEMKLNQKKRNSSPIEGSKLKTTEKSCDLDELTAAITTTAISSTNPKNLEKETSPIDMTRSLNLDSKPNTAPIRANKIAMSVPSRPQTIHCEPGVTPKSIQTKPSPITNRTPSPALIKSIEKKTDNTDGLFLKQYAELVERVSILEDLVEKLKGKLEIETEMRMELQVKIENLIGDDAITEH